LRGFVVFALALGAAVSVAVVRRAVGGALFGKIVKPSG
jgi:hypothetical protein